MEADIPLENKCRKELNYYFGSVLSTTMWVSDWFIFTKESFDGCWHYW